MKKSQCANYKIISLSPPKIYIYTELTSKNQVVIRIVDNGTGIPEHLQKHLFETFFTTKPVGKGTYNLVNKNNCQIIACVPWHWHSKTNGCNSENKLGQRFCQLGTQLWGEEKLTWRSATAFDSVLIILRILEQFDIRDSQSLLIHMNKYFKEDKKQVKGVTGIIQFEKNGDRINPPVEIVTVKWNAQQHKWQWTI